MFGAGPCAARPRVPLLLASGRGPGRAAVPARFPGDARWDARPFRISQPCLLCCQEPR